jgi:hypothetical protein
MYDYKNFLGLGQSDHIYYVITLSVITLSNNYYILISIFIPLKITFFLRKGFSGDPLAHGHVGLEEVGEDVVELVDPCYLAESGPRELLFRGRVVDPVRDEGSVEVRFLFAGPAFAGGFRLRVDFPFSDDL